LLSIDLTLWEFDCGSCSQTVSAFIRGYSFQNRVLGLPAERLDELVRSLVGIPIERGLAIGPAKGWAFIDLLDRRLLLLLLRGWWRIVTSLRHDDAVQLVSHAMLTLDVESGCNPQ
jgi:hypothetical protein